MIGIDRPGYGLSTPLPGRSIADWVPDGIAVADHLGIDRFVAVGVSTGGAYALALAALHPDRVLGVLACCALTDMQWEEGRDLDPRPRDPRHLGARPIARPRSPWQPTCSATTA